MNDVPVPTVSTCSNQSVQTAAPESDSGENAGKSNLRKHALNGNKNKFFRQTLLRNRAILCINLCTKGLSPKLIYHSFHVKLHKQRQYKLKWNDK